MGAAGDKIVTPFVIADRASNGREGLFLGDPIAILGSGSSGGRQRSVAPGSGGGGGGGISLLAGFTDNLGWYSVSSGTYGGTGATQRTISPALISDYSNGFVLGSQESDRGNPHKAPAWGFGQRSTRVTDAVGHVSHVPQGWKVLDDLQGAYTLAIPMGPTVRPDSGAASCYFPPSLNLGGSGSAGTSSVGRQSSTTGGTYAGGGGSNRNRFCSLVEQDAGAGGGAAGAGYVHHQARGMAGLLATFFTTNPCQPGWAPVLTPDGIATFDDIDVGSTIWSGSRWTTVTAKAHTGEKPVFGYRTRAGTFYGTEDHRIMQGGLRCPVRDADAIDVATAVPAENVAHEPQDVLDGMVLGDGTVKPRSTKHPFLILGEKDDYVHQSEVAHLLIDVLPGYGKGFWKIRTTLTHHELPKTYEREIPDRFLYGSPSKVAGFLRGLYAANGSVCGGRVTLKAASFDVIEGVQQMLSSLGIRSYYTVNRPHDVEFRNGTYTCRQSYDLNVSTDRFLWESLVGFVDPAKAQRLRDSGATNPKRTKTSYEIVEIEDLGVEPVYDITVEADEHTYWTGGLLVSNCQDVMGHGRDGTPIGILGGRCDAHWEYDDLNHGPIKYELTPDLTDAPFPAGTLYKVHMAPDYGDPPNPASLVWRPWLRLPETSETPTPPPPPPTPPPTPPPGGGTTVIDPPDRGPTVLVDPIPGYDGPTGGPIGPQPPNDHENGAQVLFHQPAYDRIPGTWSISGLLAFSTSAIDTSTGRTISYVGQFDVSQAEEQDRPTWGFTLPACNAQVGGSIDDDPKLRWGSEGEDGYVVLGLDTTGGAGFTVYAYDDSDAKKTDLPLVIGMPLTLERDVTSNGGAGDRGGIIITDPVSTSGTGTGTLGSVPLSEDGASVTINAKITGSRTDSGGTSAGYDIAGNFVNDSGTVTQSGATAAVATMQHADLSGTSVAFNINGTDVEIQATGDTGLDIDWSAFITYAKVVPVDRRVGARVR